MAAKAGSSFQFGIKYLLWGLFSGKEPGMCRPTQSQLLGNPSGAGLSPTANPAPCGGLRLVSDWFAQPEKAETYLDSCSSS